MAKKCNKEGCSNPVFGKGYCSWHQYLRTDRKDSARSNYNRSSDAKTKEIKNNGLKRSSGRIKPISDKQAQRLKEYRKVRDQFMKTNKSCEVCGTSSNLTLHHSAGRVGNLLTDTRYFVVLCMSCHTYYETHPKEAKEKGISVSRLEVFEGSEKHGNK